MLDIHLSTNFGSNQCFTVAQKTGFTDGRQMDNGHMNGQMVNRCPHHDRSSAVQ